MIAPAFYQVNHNENALEYRIDVFPDVIQMMNQIYRAKRLVLYVLFCLVFQLWFSHIDEWYVDETHVYITKLKSLFPSLFFFNNGILYLKLDWTLAITLNYFISSGRHNMYSVTCNALLNVKRRKIYDQHYEEDSFRDSNVESQMTVVYLSIRSKGNPSMF